jgi:phenylacetate-CoA oxygenase PaaI subunit
MNNLNPVATYALRLGDNGLVLAQRLGAWCGHAPELEIDLALANIGLDLLGQARNFLSYAAELAGSGDEDTLAYGRDERQYGNLLLVEQPNGNFADTIARQFFIDAWHVALFTRLVNSRDAQIAAIAAKGLKEVRYHLRFSRGWLERLGNGTEVSAQKMQQAVDGLWRFTGSCSSPTRWSLPLSSRVSPLTPATCRRSGRVRFTPRCLTPGCRSRKRRRFATAANRDCTVNISGRCWRKCSICNALIPVSSGNRRWLCNVSPISHPQKSTLSGRC